MTRKMTHLAKQLVPWKITETCQSTETSFPKIPQQKLGAFEVLVSEIFPLYLDHNF